MHYFKRNIGDYHKKAGRLSMLEHGAYTLLIDACYDRERFPTIDDALDWSWARTDEEVGAVKFVLAKFFILEGDIYKQSRIQDEIDKYHSNSATNKRIALEREEKKRTKRERSVNEAAPNQEPRTNKPLTINQEKKNNTSKEIRKSKNQLLLSEQKIVDLFHAHLPELPKVIKLTENRKRQINALSKKDLPNEPAWIIFFEIISSSDFLMGRAGDWKCNFDWIIKPANALKISEGNYTNKITDNRYSDVTKNNLKNISDWVPPEMRQQ